MAKRPRQHIIGDQGVAEVMRALTAEGWACDINRSDYGEDLVCQTVLNGEIDAHRILIQVKSTTKVLEDDVSIRIDTQTLRKWLSASNLVVLCVWSMANNKIYYAIPATKIDLSTAIKSNHRTLPVRVECKNILDPPAISNLSWTARFRNLSLQFAEHETRGRFLGSDFYTVGLKKEERDAEIKKCERALSAIVAQFLIHIGLFYKTNAGWSVNSESFAEDMCLLGAGPIKTHGLKIEGFTILDELLRITLWMRAHRVLSYKGEIPRNLLSAASRLYAHHLINEYVSPSEREEDRESELLQAAHNFCLAGASLSPPQLDEFLSFLKQKTPGNVLKLITMELIPPEVPRSSEASSANDDASTSK